MKILSLLPILGLLAAPLAGAAGEVAKLETPGGMLAGTLLVPESAKPRPVVLFIAGSGPTDRDGNSAALPGANNSLKLLAEGLAGRGIPSLRYDKRGIGASKAAMTAEKDLRFDTYVDDAVGWVRQLNEDARFSGVIISGHSEGALIGTVAAEKVPVLGLISIAGVSRPADAVIRAQLAGKLPADLAEISEKALVALKNGKAVDEVPQSLAMLYRPSVQPYLISWFRYDPVAETQKVKAPLLVVQGTTDIQVGVEDARALAAAKPDAKLEIIEGMNHVLKAVDADRAKQVASYSDPALPLAPRLVEAIASFVENVGKTGAR